MSNNVKQGDRITVNFAAYDGKSPRGNYTIGERIKTPLPGWRWHPIDRPDFSIPVADNDPIWAQGAVSILASV